MTTTQADNYTPTTDSLHAIALLVNQARPDWPPALVLSVLEGHATNVDGSDLAIAAIRAARTPTYRTPKTIGWRGPHWDGLTTQPAGMLPTARCGVCGKFEDRCLTQRIGLDDDHEFEPTPGPARPGVRLYPPVR